MQNDSWVSSSGLINANVLLGVTKYVWLAKVTGHFQSIAPIGRCGTIACL